MLTGCAQHGLYDWGVYDELLYQQYKDPAKALEMRTRLETHIAEIEKNGGKVAPGMYAELGTLYMQVGNTRRSIELYKREANVWPESKGMTNAMVSTLERREATKDAAR